MPDQLNSEIYSMVDGKMMRTIHPIRTTEEQANFVIVCNFGDWSIACTLAECKALFPELENGYQPHQVGRASWYAVIERFYSPPTLRRINDKR